MLGRAKGRARGRSRGGAPPEARHPCEPQLTLSSEQQHIGRGRGRAVTSAPPPAQQHQPLSEPPVQQMAAMRINGSGKQQPEARRGGRGAPFTEPHTRPEHITDKCGVAGTQIPVMSNYIVLRNRPDCAIFQYNISHIPQVDSRKRRIGMLYQQEISARRKSHMLGQTAKTSGVKMVKSCSTAVKGGGFIFEGGPVFQYQ